MIRPSTAGYTNFMSEMYLDKTEMSISPARGGKKIDGLVSIWLVFYDIYQIKFYLHVSHV